MLDLDLFFANNERPALAVGDIWFPAAFPGNTGNVKWIDFKTAVDMGRGQPIYARFRVETTFAGATQNQIRYVVMVDDATDFSGVLTNPSKIIARGPDITKAELVAGVEHELVVPSLSTLVLPSGATQGMRYLTLGIEALIPSTPGTDFTAGAWSAWLSPNPGRVRPSSYRSGY